MNHLETKQHFLYRTKELSQQLETIKQAFNNNKSLDDALFAIAHETKKELSRVKQVIRNIEKNEYGKCIQCGSEIDSIELSRNPYQSTCSCCANKQDNEVNLAN